MDALFLVEPEFISNPENLTVIKGQNVSLQCKVYGNPVPDVTWTKDGEAINIADQRISVSFTGNTSSLTIVSIVQADQGLYRCVANNSVLSNVTSSPGTLTVHCEYLIVLFSLDAQLITASTGHHVSINQGNSLVKSISLLCIFYTECKNANNNNARTKLTTTLIMSFSPTENE